ncbi:MAG TPA: GDSL-type esterase/lipase family protein [Mycobacteriales bacterium]|nr:GDSL-type esterase/lipase family protein [Mycobacteriales bacterium]
MVGIHRAPPVRLAALTALAAAIAIGGSASTAAGAPAPPAGADAATAGRGATAVWAASLEGVHGVSPDVTVRQIERVSVAASSLRVRVGNPFGQTPVVIREAWLGRTLAPGTAQLLPGTNHRLTFGGATRVTLAPGESRFSDAVPLSVPAQQDVAVSIYAPGSPVNDHTFPPFPADPPATYIGTGGNTAADPSARAFPSAPVIPGNSSSTATGYHPGQTWWSDLLVAGHAEARATLVTLGDSITDGYQALGPPGQRWTDVLAVRLNELPARRRLAVANAGISGNTVSIQPNPYDPTGQCCGPPAPQRLDRDVLAVPGVRTVFLLEGTNDIGGGVNAAPAPASQVIAAMAGIARRVHARGLRIVGATVLPMCMPAGGPQEAARQAVNTWIRTSRAFDGVVDFDAVLRDPADPTVMVADLRTDCYHPNAAGDALLGAAIPLGLLG